MRQKGGEGTRLLYIVLFVRKKARINYLFEIVQNVTATRRYKISKKIALLFLKRRMLKTCHSFDAIMLYESIGPHKRQQCTSFIFWQGTGGPDYPKIRIAKISKKQNKQRRSFRFFFSF